MGLPGELLLRVNFSCSEFYELSLFYRFGIAF
jgi:hypothetical protein